MQSARDLRISDAPGNIPRGRKESSSTPGSNQFDTNPRAHTHKDAAMSSALEAKIVVLGSQGVGKTSLVMRYCKGAFQPSQLTSTVGASFMTKRVVDTDTDTVVRLQIWDTGKSSLESRPAATVSPLVLSPPGRQC